MTAELMSKIMGPNPVKLEEELLTDHHIQKGATVCDLGSGQGLTSIFLVKEYGFKVYAADLWSDPEENRQFFSSMGLSEEQVTRLLEKVNSVLEDVSVISRDDFSLAMLAKMVGSNTKYVSMVINDTYGKNFKTYLNEFRIREACRRLSDTQHYGNMTIQAIYEELGYKTASSFVKAFRKINGMTPSQYQKLKSQLAE